MPKDAVQDTLTGFNTHIPASNGLVLSRAKTLSSMTGFASIYRHQASYLIDLTVTDLAQYLYRSFVVGPNLLNILGTINELLADEFNLNLG